VGDVRDRGFEGVSFRVQFEGETACVESHLPGAHTLPAVAAGIGVGLALGMTLQEAATAASAVRTPGRMRILRAANGATVIDDRYNSSPASLDGALRMLATAKGGRRIALLGRMAELGEFEDVEHRRAGETAAGCCDVLAAVGEPCRVMVDAARSAGLAEAHWFESKDDAAAFVRASMRAGDTVLVKASRSQAFEEILPVLEGAR
jgi:UDP-N-acetylmuramoyl-tripeptide--D-alanyl-D-alanine ligase